MRQVIFFVTVLLLLTSCVQQENELPNSDPGSGSSLASAKRTPTPTPIPEKTDSSLEVEMAKIAEVAKGRVGVGAVLLETGETAYVDRNGHYPMQSVYKLPIAMAVLKMMDEGKVRIDQEVSITPDDFVRPGFHSPIRNVNPQGTVMNVFGIMRYSISESDGTASDVLLDLAGGPGAVQKYLDSLGIGDEMIVADSEKSISKDWETQYRNWSSPEASIELLRSIQTGTAGLSETATRILLQFMTESETGRRRIKRGLPDGASFAHKTGTGGTEKGITGATNDVGIVTLPDGKHLLIAVYVSDSPESGAVREKVMADIARAVIEKWSPGSYPDDRSNENGGNAGRKAK